MLRARTRRGLVGGGVRAVWVLEACGVRQWGVWGEGRASPDLSLSLSLGVRAGVPGRWFRMRS